jgi:hypothetical protein
MWDIKETLINIKEHKLPLWNIYEMKIFSKKINKTDLREKTIY